MAYFPVKWNAYQGAVRDWDVCFQRVDRSHETGTFNRVLVNIITREIPNRTDISEELNAALPAPLDLLTTCGREPKIIDIFIGD